MLTIREHMTLQFADLAHKRMSWLSREGLIRHTFSEPPTHYYARLDRLIDRPEAIAEYPMLCARLRRLRDARKAERSKQAG